jgi:hypothetical protein
MSTTVINIAILGGLLLVLGTGIARRWLKLLYVRLMPESEARRIGQAAVARQPDEIHLVRADGSAWKQPEVARRMAASFSQTGFVAAGTYVIRELEGVTCGFLVHGPESAYAIVYEHPKVGHWAEIVSRYRDGAVVTFSNSRSPQLDHPPNRKVVRTTDLEPAAMWARARAERPQGTLEPVSADTIVHAFEDAWRESIAWRKARGGATREEIERVARARNWKR